MIRKTTLSILMLYFFFLIIGIFLFLTHSNDFNTFSTKLLTYDSLLYRERAIEFAISNYTVLEFIKKYGLNYSVISILGSKAFYNNKFHDFVIFIGNNILLLFCFIYFTKILRICKIKFEIFLPYYFLLALYLYLPFSTIMLNKEIIGFLFISTVSYYYLKEKYYIIFFLGLFFGVIRIQYGVLTLFLFLYRFIFKRDIFLSFIFINLITIKYSHPLVLQWASHVNEKINSLNLMLSLENISYTPVIGIISNIMRIFISLFVGIKAPYDIIITSFREGRFIYLVSIFILSLISLYFFYNFKKYYKFSKYLSKHNKNKNFLLSFDIIIVYMIVHSIIPFLQPRYYLPLIFLFIINILSYKTINKYR